MFSRIFPRDTQAYNGHKAALYLFYVLTVITLMRSLTHMFSADGGAQSIATIPLDQFTENGTAAVVLVFALWGLSQLIVGLLYVFACFRYRGLIPSFYLLLIFEYAMRIYLTHIKPVVVEGVAPGAIGDYVMVPVAIMFFFLSICKPGSK